MLNDLVSSKLARFGLLKKERKKEKKREIYRRINVLEIELCFEGVRDGVQW